MGQQFIDQYSLLHFAVGIVAYFWNIDMIMLLLIHIVFEVSENSIVGMNIINNIKIWPGGKPEADSMVNQIGDTISSILGWYTAYYLDKMGDSYGWYEPHIIK
jgi:hypothetical protein